MVGKVTVWQMTEEERLAYIEKHPIKPMKRPKGTSYLSLKDRSYAKRKAREGTKSRWGSTGFGS